MALGPLEFMVIGFTGNQFTGEILPALEDIREKGIVRVVDLVFVSKDSDGDITSIEVSDLEGADAARYGSILRDLMGLLTPEDVATASSDLPPNSSAAIILFEHTWAVALRDAIRRSGGALIAQERVAPEALEEVAAELAAVT